MKAVLALYAQRYDGMRPTVCFDEQPVQLLADAHPSRPLMPGFPPRRDYEYVRGGTRHVFLFIEPKVGQRHLLVTRHRTKEDFAKAMRYLVDELYPDVQIIDVVLDQLNTHHAETLIVIFGKAEADRLLKHLQFHPTPLHASWLNIAEIDLSVLTRQCLDRRMPDAWRLIMESLAWEYRRNALSQPIAWSFDWKRARRFLRDHKRRQKLRMTTGQN
jgi:DDE superfamily endonuclease